MVDMTVTHNTACSEVRPAPSYFKDINTDRVRLWVEALREQADCQCACDLRIDLSCAKVCLFCALGLACEVYRFHVGGKWVGKWFMDAKGYRSGSAMAGDVVRWYGFADDNPIIMFRGQITRVSCVNDAGYSFTQIADAIEAYYLSPSSTAAIADA